MHQSKSSKILKKARSSIYSFTEKYQQSLNPKDLNPSQTSKKSKRSIIQEKLAKDSQNFLENSISELKPSQIPKPKTEKFETSISKEKRPKDLSPVLVSSKEILKKPSIKTTISPKLHKNLSPLIEIYSEGTKTKASNFRKKEKNMFRHLNLIKEIELNQKILNNPHKFKAKSCLEDLILLGESKNLTSFAFIEENLKTCTRILRNVMGRLLEIGKSNEAVLIEKFWRHLVETVDQTIEAFMNNNLKNESMIYGKVECFNHHKTQDCETLVKIEEIELRQSGFIDKSNDLEVFSFTDLITRVQDEIKVLIDLCHKGKNLNIQAKETLFQTETPKSQTSQPHT